MLKSLNAWTVDPKSNFKELFHDVKNAGFDGVELNIDRENESAHSITLETSKKELEEIKEISDKYSLPIVSISTSLWSGMMSLQTKRGEAERLLLKQLDCAAVFGAGGILVVPGTHERSISHLTAWNNSVNFLKEMTPEIEKYKINVGVENVWNAFFTSPFDMVKFCEQINCKYVGTYFDVGNVAAFSYSENWIEILAPYIKNIHVKDFKLTSNINLGGSWADLTKGSINWQNVREAFENVGFEGYLTAEVFKQDEEKSFTNYYSEIVGQLREIIGE